MHLPRYTMYACGSFFFPLSELDGEMDLCEYKHATDYSLA